MRLAVRARTRGVSAADVDRAVSVDRSLAVGWLCRGTLHLVRSEDYWWLHALTAPRQLTATMRRLGQEGVEEGAVERGVTAIERSLAREGPLRSTALAESVADAGVRVERQAMVHLLGLASLRGLIVRGPIVGARQAWALARDWLGEPETVDPERAFGELARRYLAGHGPATDRDLAKWAGLPLRDVRKGLAAIGSELEVRADGLAALARRPHAAELPPPRLLGAFEPVLLGWTSRDDILGERAEAVVSGGLFRPFALVEGRVAATWRLAGQEIAIEPLAPLRPDVAAALDTDAAEVLRFFG